jgi:hypothetical protein
VGALLFILLSCTGEIGEPRDGAPPSMRPDAPTRFDPGERPLRPLTRRELSNTLDDLLGREVVGLLDSIPGDSHALVYDRVGAAQTVSALHVDGFLAMAAAITKEGAGDDALLVRLMPGCNVAALGPRARESTASAIGSSLQGPDPEYVVCYAGDDWGGENRCPEVTDPDEVKLHFDGAYVTLRQPLESSGRYRIEIDASAVYGSGGTVIVGVDGSEAGRISIPAARTPAERTYASHSVELDLAAGERAIVLSRSSSSAVYLQRVRVIGPVDVNAVAERAARVSCAASYAASFAPRAWRRPLTADESSAVVDLFTAGIDDGFFFDGLRMALEYTLQAPEFLYHVEIGAPGPDPGLHALDSFEIASRLSYLAWGTAPDDDLRSAAERDELGTPAQVRVHADRLFADPRAHDTVRRFYEQWLELDDLEYLTKDGAIFPEFTSGVRAAMLEETRTFFDELVWNEAATMSDLLISERRFAPGELAAIYGAGEGRLGLLTHPSILAINAKPNGHSPVRRGAFVLDRILCAPLPPRPTAAPRSRREGVSPSTSRTTRAPRATIRSTRSASRSRTSTRSAAIARPRTGSRSTRARGSRRSVIRSAAWTVRRRSRARSPSRARPTSACRAKGSATGSDAASTTPTRRA